MLARSPTGVPFFESHTPMRLPAMASFDLAVKGPGRRQRSTRIIPWRYRAFRAGTGFCPRIADKAGITRFADVCIPMDETLVQAAVDILRPAARHTAICRLPTQRVGLFEVELAVEFFYAFARHAGVTLHVRELAGENSHRGRVQGGRAMRFARESVPRVVGNPFNQGFAIIGTHGRA